MQAGDQNQDRIVERRGRHTIVAHLQLLGHVRVEESRTLDSVVTPVAFGGKPKPAELPKTGLCEVVSVDCSAKQIRVAIDPGKEKPDEAKRVYEQIAQVALSPPAELIGLSVWSLAKLRDYLLEQKIVSGISIERLRQATQPIRSPASP